MTIKKVFQPIIELLQSNLQATVSDLMGQIEAIAMAKPGGGGGDGSPKSVLNPDGTPHAIFCYYHRKWELVSEVEFGAKLSSATKLNSMCKEGAARWSAQNTKSKTDTADLLPSISSGDLAIADIPSAQAKIETTRTFISPREDGHGSDTQPIPPTPERDLVNENVARPSPEPRAAH